MCPHLCVCDIPCILWSPWSLPHCLFWLASVSPLPHSFTASAPALLCGSPSKSKDRCLQCLLKLCAITLNGIPFRYLLLTVAPPAPHIPALGLHLFCSAPAFYLGVCEERLCLRLRLGLCLYLTRLKHSAEWENWESLVLYFLPAPLICTYLCVLLKDLAVPKDSDTILLTDVSDCHDWIFHFYDFLLILLLTMWWTCVWGLGGRLSTSSETSEIQYLAIE